MISELWHKNTSSWWHNLVAAADNRLTLSWRLYFVLCPTAIFMFQLRIVTYCIKNCAPLYLRHQVIQQGQCDILGIVWVLVSEKLIASCAELLTRSCQVFLLDDLFDRKKCKRVLIKVVVYFLHTIKVIMYKYIFLFDLWCILFIFFRWPIWFKVSYVL